jgi:hypothetical protein
MTTVLCFCRVADFEVFLAGHMRAAEATPELLFHRIWRGQDDPSLVAIEERYASREVAEAIWTSPEAEQAIVDDGIDPASIRIEYLDEVLAEPLFT